MDIHPILLLLLLVVFTLLSLSLALPADPLAIKDEGFQRRKPLIRYEDAPQPLPVVEGGVGGGAAGGGGGGQVVAPAADRAVVTAAPSVLELRMPAVHPDKEDAYICTSMQVPAGNNYIVRFDPSANTSTVHHLLVFGCLEPKSRTGSWPDGGLCKPGTNSGKIMFAWARNAPPTKLPTDVGFEIGEVAQVKWLVLQIHYKNPISLNEPGDTSGVRLTVTPQHQRYIAGIYILMSIQATIPPHTKKTHADISCEFQSDATIHPIAFRPHAHDLGTVITGYVYNASGWTMLGKGNPQWPQAFYPMEGGRQMVIRPGDKVVARCTYDSTDRNVETHIGGAHTDEMCNFYIMYYTERVSGAESYYACAGNSFKELFADIPPGSDTPLPPNPALDELAAGHAHKAHSEAAPPSSLSSLSVVLPFPDLDPLDASLELGQVAGVDTDSQGNVYVFHRGPVVWDDESFDVRNIYQFADNGPIIKDTIIVFNPDGKVVDQWGKNRFYMPHGLTVDQNDNLWVTDVALHQVMRFPKGSRSPDLILGQKFTPGFDDESFCKPTDVAVLPTGEFFIADGYCNNRIVKYSKEGEKLKEWGKSTQTVEESGFPPPFELNVPHSLSLLPELARLCVADRENGRVQCFDYDGAFVSQMHPAEFQGHAYAIAYSNENGLLYAVNGPNAYDQKVTVQGMTLHPTTGQVLESWMPAQGFARPHDIAVSPDGLCVYVAEIGPNKIWKFHVDAAHMPAGNSVHQSVKKGSPGSSSGGHPSSVDMTRGEALEDAIEKEVDSDAADFGASLVIGALLIVPVLIIVSVTVFLRLRKSGKLRFFDGNHKYNNRRFNLGSLLGNRHKGFDPLNQDECDELNHLNSDDSAEDVDEYSATVQKA